MAPPKRSGKEWFRKYFLEGEMAKEKHYFQGMGRSHGCKKATFGWSQDYSTMKMVKLWLESYLNRDLKICYSLRSSTNRHSNGSSQEPGPKCTMVYEVNREASSLGRRAYSLHDRAHHLVELRNQVQLLGSLSWQIFYFNHHDFRIYKRR